MAMGSAFQTDMGPLTDGQTAVIIGGGPGGASCGIALKKLAREMGRDITVAIYEGKTFAGETHYNQCVGVLSPPIETILEDSLGVPFPYHLVQRQITGYILHIEGSSIVLDGDDEPSHVLRRVNFDDYLLEQARCRGVEVITSRVTDLEFHADRVLVYSESDNREAAVIVGAFGLDDGTATLLARATAYRQPHFLSSIVTKVHPSAGFHARFGNRIHAFLPPVRQIEFGAVTPKGNHLTINIAGAQVDTPWMDWFLHWPAVTSVLPPLDFAHPRNPKDLAYHKGRFPISTARHFFGDRYAVVGDAAGLVRPFKGKGVTSACLTALRAAETIMRHGVSREAFRAYADACRDITSDLPYGRTVRWLAIFGSTLHLLPSVLEVARRDERLRRALFNAVSAHRTYREIIHEILGPRGAVRVAAEIGFSLAHARW